MSASRTLPQLLQGERPAPGGRCAADSFLSEPPAPPHHLPHGLPLGAQAVPAAESQGGPRCGDPGFCQMRRVIPAPCWDEGLGKPPHRREHVPRWYPPWGTHAVVPSRWPRSSRHVLRLLSAARSPRPVPAGSSLASSTILSFNTVLGLQPVLSLFGEDDEALIASGSALGGGGDLHCKEKTNLETVVSVLCVRHVWGCSSKQPCSKTASVK